MSRCHRKIEGTPYFVYIVLGVLLLWTLLLQRTRYGRYVYAIGGNAEAARRAGVNVPMIRTVAFVLCSVTAGIAGLLYAAQLGGVSNNVNGGQLVLYAVAAAVIGGTSLFGGRGKAVHGVLGGLVIGGIYNGMGLLGLSVQWQFIVTGLRPARRRHHRRLVPPRKRRRPPVAPHRRSSYVRPVRALRWLCVRPRGCRGPGRAGRPVRTATA